MSDEAVANILDGLSDGVHEDDFGGEGASISHHGERVDDGNGIEKGLNQNVPDGGNVAVLDVD